MAKFKPNLLPTAIGSMPHTDPREACSLITKYLPTIPVWPQLPNRSFQENMYAQFSEGFPGVIVEGDQIYINRSQNLDQQLEQLYTDYLENKLDQYAPSPDYAAGLDAFLSLGIEPFAVKGQVTGPISWGLTVTDQEHRAVLYDETIADATAKHLRLKAAQQERALSAISPNTIIFIDEPYMASFGSAFLSLSREQVIELLEEVFKGINGLKGIHCCGNTDWSVLLDTSVDILSLDAYNHARSISLYPSEVKSFLERGGSIAWGIVPNEEGALTEESVASLKDRLEEAIAPLTRKGIHFKQLTEQGLITPSCGLASLSKEAATQALELLAELSARMRKRYAS